MSKIEGLSVLIQRYSKRVAETGSPAARDVQFAAHQVERAMLHLGFALDDVEASRLRYEAAESAWTSLMHREVGVYRLTNEEVRVLEEHSVVHELLPYRIEVFFSQARIVLDRLARLLHFAFQPSAITIGSFSDLRRNLPRLTAERQIDLPVSLLESTDRLTQDIKRIRDRLIVHPHGPLGHRIRRIADVNTDSGVTRLKIKWAADDDAAAIPAEYSEDPLVLRNELESYVNDVVDFIQTFAPSPEAAGDD